MTSEEGKKPKITSSRCDMCEKDGAVCVHEVCIDCWERLHNPAPDARGWPRKKEWNQVTGREGKIATDNWNACYDACAPFMLKPLEVDVLANFIRVFDGNHDKGAGAIAEAICKTFGSPAVPGVQVILSIINDVELKANLADGTTYLRPETKSELAQAIHAALVAGRVEG
jgi:hypothetical protein